MRITTQVRRDLFYRQAQQNLRGWDKLDSYTRERFIDDAEAACRSFETSGKTWCTDLIKAKLQDVVDKFDLKGTL